MTDSPREDEPHAEEPPSPAWQPPPWARTTAQSPWPGNQQWSPSKATPYGPWGSYPAFGREHGSSPIAVVAGTVLLLIGAFITLIALVMLAFGAGGGAFLDAAAEGAGMPGQADALATIIVVFSVVFLIVGLLQMVAAIGVFAHKEWARWLGLALGALGLALGALLVLGSVGGQGADLGTWIITIVWVSAYVAVLAGLAAGGEHFGTRVRSSY